MTEFPTRKPIRLQPYDYSAAGWYFITVCSKDRQSTFGKYENGVGAGLASARKEIVLSPIGHIIDRQWNDLNNQYGNVTLDQYGIMPNHIHGILIIDNRADARPAPTLSDIVCSFKSRCTVESLKQIRQTGFTVNGEIWQRSFYDHVIRNEQSLNAIREYISNNLENWEQDIENLEKLNRRSKK